MTILVIEDEIQLAQILEKALKSRNYGVEICHDGLEGYEKALKHPYSIIILDIMLPNKDGLKICEDLRAKGIQTPIIMLTARGTEDDKVKGLNIGADDYLVKPFGLEELFARILAVQRRRRTLDPDIFKIDDLIYDSRKHEASRGGKVIELTPKEHKLLYTLIKNMGRAMTRDELLSDAWGPEFKEGNNELNVHIAYLRRKIDDGFKKPLIKTIRGVGYILRE